MVDYQMPSDEAMAKVGMDGVEAHFIGAYIRWDSHENARIAREHGMKQEKPSRANWWDHENLDNAQTGIHDHGMFRKFGFGRGCQQISVDVRNGRISREEALEWVLGHDHLFPVEYAGVEIEAVLERLGVDLLWLDRCLDQFTNKETQWQRLLNA